MVWPTLNFNVIFDNCFSGLWNSGGRQPRADIRKLMTEMEKLRAERNDIRNKIQVATHEGRLATEEAKQWQRDLESLEGQVAVIFENFTRIIFRENIKIGPWGGNGVSSFDTGGSVSRITRIRVQAGSIVDGLQVSYVNVDRNNVETPLVGGNGGAQHVVSQLANILILWIIIPRVTDAAVPEEIIPHIITFSLLALREITARIQWPDPKSVLAAYPLSEVERDQAADATLGQREGSSAPTMTREEEDRR
ncbi:hypothetical protein ZIOFF_076080 [Zingiber officinale]|uniref:Jacalin-type lectin domain-containing protein n=1 Tax=Zingiber officinale TaxID=94328 RepID=A0A8J5C441_ZINOF|nr:hypothetical protein ZIOFF_076080 [Zingiber officinale]